MKIHPEKTCNSLLFERLDNHLEKCEFYDFLDMLMRLKGITTWTSFEQFVYKELRRFLPYDNIIFAYVKRDDFKKIKPAIDILNVSYAPQYIEEYIHYDMNVTDACVQDFFRTGRLHRWLDINAINPNPDPAADTSFDYKMNDGLTYGAFDSDNPEYGTTLCIGSETEDNSERNKVVFAMMAQVFAKHFMLIRKFPRPPQRSSKIELRPMEQKTLWLAGKGVPRKAIAYELGVSNTTVDKRLTKARKILGVQTDQEAHEVAISLGCYTSYDDGLGVTIRHSNISKGKKISDYP